MKEAFLKMVVPLLLHRKDLEVRVAERLRFTVSTDLCVQAQPIDTLYVFEFIVDIVCPNVCDFSRSTLASLSPLPIVARPHLSLPCLLSPLVLTSWYNAYRAMHHQLQRDRRREVGGTNTGAAGAAIDVTAHSAPATDAAKGAKATAVGCPQAAKHHKVKIARARQ